jgi:tetratricopeptide (TPR) repeat protein
LAQSNQPDKALADLRLAVKKGYKNIELVKTDTKLDPLRTREEFGELLKELERELKSPVKQPPAKQSAKQSASSVEAVADSSVDEALTVFLTAMKQAPQNDRSITEIRNFISDRADAFSRTALIERVDRELCDSPRRTDWNAMRGHWAEALDGMLKRIEGHPQDHFPWYQTAFLYARSGDLAGYRRHCREVLTRFGDTRDPVICERIAKACLLVPGAPDDAQRPRQLADRAIALAPQHESLAYFELAQGLAEYRAGEFARACAALERCLADQNRMGLYGVALAKLLTAMCRFQQGDAEEARPLLVKATRYCDSLPQTSNGQLLYLSDWHDGIAVDLIRREAEELFMKGARSKKTAELPE